MNLGDLRTPDGEAKYFDIHLRHNGGEGDIFVDDAYAIGKKANE